MIEMGIVYCNLIANRCSVVIFDRTFRELKGPKQFPMDFYGGVFTVRRDK